MYSYGSAYMLVYIRMRDWPVIMKPLRTRPPLILPVPSALPLPQPAALCDPPASGMLLGGNDETEDVPRALRERLAWEVAEEGLREKREREKYRYTNFKLVCHADMARFSNYRFDHCSKCEEEAGLDSGASADRYVRRHASEGLCGCPAPPTPSILTCSPLLPPFSLRIFIPGYAERMHCMFAD
jgi:hypothetical protein